MLCCIINNIKCFDQGEMKQIAEYKNNDEKSTSYKGIRYIT